MTDTTQQEIPMVTVDGVNFPIHNLPEDIKELLEVYQGWEAELKTQKVAIFKTEAAIRAVGSEIQTRVRNMAAAAKASMEASDQAANDAPPATVEVETEGGSVD